MKNFLFALILPAALLFTSCAPASEQEPLKTCPQGEVDPGTPSEGCY